MFFKIPCIHIKKGVNSTTCTHPEIKRTFFGFGPKKCIDKCNPWVNHKGNNCEFKELPSKGRGPGNRRSRNNYLSK